MSDSAAPGYRWVNAELTHSHGYLLPVLLRETMALLGERKLFELGCGNGSVANALARQGWDVTGVDPSIQGIALANAQYPELKLFEGSAYDNLAEQFGQFPVVTSLEYAAALFDLVAPGGTAIVSTPFHGYWKNLALALTGKMDSHFTALWDNGHIKFWSVKTLGELLREAGFVDIRFRRVGRIPALAKSMVAVARKP
jgi:SAM-dependent methyltransferase